VGDINCVMAALPRPSTTLRHFSNDGWMPATSSGVRRLII